MMGIKSITSQGYILIWFGLKTFSLQEGLLSINLDYEINGIYIYIHVHLSLWKRMTKCEHILTYDHLLSPSKYNYMKASGDRYEMNLIKMI